MTDLARRRDGSPAPAPDAPPPGRRADALVAVGALGLVALAVGVGIVLLARGVPILVDAPPLLAQWFPHVGPGTPVAIATAVAVVAWGPALATRLRWGPLLVVGYAASLLWTVSLALVDGYVAGFAGRLTTLTEYLRDVPRITDVAVFLENFARLVPNGQPGFWVTHVAGHPPLATLFYVWLDRLGLGGGEYASAATVAVACTGVVAVAVALRAVGAEGAARAFLPFGVLFPGAVWVGVSADGMFAAVLAWGVALTALAAGRGRAGGLGLGLVAGLLLGAALFCNYGLVVALLIPLAVLVRARSWWPAVTIVAGIGAVTAAFAAAGFWWYDGYTALLLRYGQPGEFGGMRPYGYFVWANLAALVLVVGVAAVVGLRRTAVAARTAGEGRAVAVLAGATLLALAVADLSGLSKAETERIWLPFALWLLPATALLPRPGVRGWLAAQAVVALAVNHLVFTVW